MKMYGLKVRKFAPQLCSTSRDSIQVSRANLANPRDRICPEISIYHIIRLVTDLQEFGIVLSMLVS